MAVAGSFDQLVALAQSNAAKHNSVANTKKDRLPAVEAFSERERILLGPLNVPHEGRR